MMPEGGIGGAITHDVAGLPTWVWGVVVVVGLGAAYILPRLGQGTSTEETPNEGPTGTVTLTLPVDPTTNLPYAFAPQPINTPEPGPTPTPTPTPAPTVKTYTVKRGDTLWDIAAKFYGSGTLWRKIYNQAQNRALIGPNYNLIHPGQVLVIPKL